MIANRSWCLEINPYKALGQLIFTLRTKNPRGVTQERFGNAVGLTRTGVGEVESGNRRLDLFEVKDIVAFFSRYSPETRQLKLVFDTYLPQGNHNTQEIHKQMGSLIYETRIFADIKRSELARQSRISDASLWRIEAGVSRVYLLEAWAIARLLRDYSEGFRQLDDALSEVLVTENINQLIAS